MKKQIVIIGLFLLSSFTVMAQNSNSGGMNHNDSLAIDLYQNEQYDKAEEVLRNEIKRLDNAGAKQDSDYFFRLYFLAKCQGYQQKFEAAIVSAQKAVDLYGKNVSKTDEDYALYLDNLAFQLSGAEKYDQAETYGKEALRLYESFGKNDEDMSPVLLHLAEIYACNNKPAEAIKYQLRALNILKKEYGEHSKEYTDEAAYLQDYYERNGENDKAKKLEERIKLLIQETEDGVVDLPPMVKFTSPAVAKDHEKDMLRYIDYLYGHTLQDSKIENCASYIMDWTAASDAVKVFFGPVAEKLTGASNAGLAYMVAYAAGCDEYALKYGEGEPCFEMFMVGVARALDYYQANKHLTGEIPFNEDLYKVLEKDEDKFQKKLRELYDEEQKVMKNAQANKMKVGERIYFEEKTDKKSKKKKK